MANSADSLIDIAIGVEKRGIAFYETIARSVRDAGAQHVFGHLADMERDHIRIFQKILPEAGGVQLGEFGDYVHSLIDNSVFTGDIIASETAISANSAIKAVELAMSAEKDSILLYYEVRDIMPGQVHSQINRIIAEEKLHFRQLSELRNRMR